MWTQFIYWLITMAVSYALTPKPKYDQPAASTLDDFQAPTASEGGPVPVLFGTRWLVQPNVVWYGDLRTTPIKSDGGKK